MKKMHILFVSLLVGLLASCTTTGKVASDEKSKSGGVGYFLSGTYDSTHQRILDWAAYYGLDIKENAKSKTVKMQDVSFKFGETLYWTDIEISYPDKNNKQLYVECTNVRTGDDRREPNDDEYFGFRTTLDLFLSGLRTGDFVFPQNREMSAPELDAASEEEVSQE